LDHGHASSLIRRDAHRFALIERIIAPKPVWTQTVRASGIAASGVHEKAKTQWSNMTREVRDKSVRAERDFECVILIDVEGFHSAKESKEVKGSRW
jgi:hypothetical protein